MMGSYVISLIAVSLICAVLLRLAGDRIPAVRFVVALTLALCVIGPISRIDLSDRVKALTPDWSGIDSLEQSWVDTGTRAFREGIRQRTEAYILREAEALGAQIQVEVGLSEDEIPVPEQVWIRGSISPYVKTKLGHILTSDLGLGGEAVEWS